MVAIFRTLYYGDAPVGAGGRVTIPLPMREALGIRDGDKLTIRVEEKSGGARQLVIWRAEPAPEDAT